MKWLTKALPAPGGIGRRAPSTVGWPLIFAFFDRLWSLGLKHRAILVERPLRPGADAPDASYRALTETF